MGAVAIIFLENFIRRFEIGAFIQNMIAFLADDALWQALSLPEIKEN